MLTFRSLDEIAPVSLPPPVHRAVFQAMKALLDAYGEDYDPDDCGYVVLVDATTTDGHALELMGRPWTDALLEGVIFDAETNCFLTCVLFNNQFGLSIVVPDEPWLDPAFRGKLREELCLSSEHQPRKGDRE